MDPHKRSVMIEVMTGDEQVLGGRPFATSVEGFPHHSFTQIGMEFSSFGSDG